MSDTPRTDAIITGGTIGQIAILEHARQLERELAEAKEQVAIHQKMWKDFISLQHGDAVGTLQKVEAWFRAGCPPAHRAELDASDAKDAARYRWLRTRPDTIDWGHSLRIPNDAATWEFGSDKGRLLDASIDAAIERTGPHGVEPSHPAAGERSKEKP